MMAADPIFLDTNILVYGEWLNLWAHEIPDVTGVGRIGPAMELATVPGIHEELDSAA